MGKAGKPLHVLRIEDSEDEVSRLADELEQGGYDPAFRQVHSREEMEEALGEKNWDVVISGYRPPLFGAEEALGLLREKQKDVPLIVISEEVGEETVRLMRSGARDFIPSGSLYRLAPAVDRELQVAEDRRERGAAEGRLRRSEERYRAVVEQTIEAIFLVDVETRRVVDSNPAFRQMFGYSEEELADLTLYEMVDNDPESIDANIEIILSNGYYRVRERRYRRRDGSLVDMEISVSLVSLGGRDVMCAVAHDITKRKVAEEEMRRHSTAIEGAIDGIAIIDAEGAYTYMNQAHASIYGYDRPEELVGRSWRIHYDEEQVKTSDRQSLPALRDSGYWRGESTGTRKDGSTFPQELSLTALEDGGVVCVVRDVTERKATEERLRQSLNALLAVYEAGQILSSTLEAEEVGTRLLQLIRRISSSATAVISTPDESGELSVWRALGFENLWRKARYTSAVQQALWEVIQNGEHRVLGLEPPEGSEFEPLAGLFLPLRIRGRTIGVLEVYGPEDMAEKETMDILLSLTSKAASAIENARLYGELDRRRGQLQDLVNKLIVTQEEERRRVAYEVHDGPAQVAVSAYQHIQALANLYSPQSPQAEELLENAVEFARRTVGESRRIISDFRPTVLDDFGLAAALQAHTETLQEEGWGVGYRENLDGERLPEEVETTLYRVAQEALTNVRKHANTRRVYITLAKFGECVRLRVRDCGVGLEQTSSPGPGEQVGLTGMRERLSLIGGELEIYSKKGSGTLVVAKIPFSEGVEIEP